MKVKTLCTVSAHLSFNTNIGEHSRVLIKLEGRGNAIVIAEQLVNGKAI